MGWRWENRRVSEGNQEDNSNKNTKERVFYYFVLIPPLLLFQLDTLLLRVALAFLAL